MLYIKFGSGWLQIFLHWTPPRLNFCSLVSVNNLPKSRTPHSTPLTLLETLASYLMNTSLFLPDLLCLQVLLLPYSSTSFYPSIPRYQNSFHHRHFHCSLQARLFITTCPSLRSPVIVTNYFLIYLVISAEFVNSQSLLDKHFVTHCLFFQIVREHFSKGGMNSFWRLM